MNTENLLQAAEAANSMQDARVVVASSVATGKSGRGAYRTHEKAKGMVVDLWPLKANANTTLRLVGKINGVEVSGFLNEDDQGKFINFVTARKPGEESVWVATGTLVANFAGIPKMRLMVGTSGEDQLVWVDVSITVKRAALVDLGFDVQRQEEKKAAHAASKILRRHDEAYA